MPQLPQPLVTAAALARCLAWCLQPSAMLRLRGCLQMPAKSGHVTHPCFIYRRAAAYHLKAGAEPKGWFGRLQWKDCITCSRAPAPGVSCMARSAAAKVLSTGWARNTGSRDAAACPAARLEPSRADPVIVPEDSGVQDAADGLAEVSYFIAPEAEAAVRGVKPSETSEPAPTHEWSRVGSCCMTPSLKTQFPHGYPTEDPSIAHWMEKQTLEDNNGST